MPPVNRIDTLRASAAAPPHHDQTSDADDPFALDDFEAELRRLSAANQELLEGLQQEENESAVAVLAPPPPSSTCESTDALELELLRQENAELRLRVEELESLGAGKGEELWLERQREYEILLEEKSEVIRSLHLKLQDAQECAIGGDAPPVNIVSTSGTKLGQAEEILRLKREMDEQRRQLAQDEEDMMAQMSQMEMAMAKERAEMARHRQEVMRLQSDLAREIEQSSRDPELRERLHTLRRAHEPKIAGPAEKPAAKNETQSSGFFRGIFG